MPATDPAAARAREPFEGIEFQALFEEAPDACVIVDEAGRIVLINEEAERMFGYPRHDLIGRAVETLVPEEAREGHARYRSGYTDEPIRRPMGIGRELHARRADGSSVAVEIGLSPIETEGGRYTLAVVRDITLRRRLRAFGSGLLQGAEEERQRIARELHDDTAQSLAALVLRLQMARRTDDIETRERLLKELNEEIHRTSAGVRRILRGLRPPLLEESGLAAALRAHAKTALAGTEIEAALELGDVEELLSREAKLALYRIVQEAVTNVIRHARAREVRIGLGTDGREVVRLTVEDDGEGFDPDRLDQTDGRGLGLLGIAERASILGGHARVESGPGRGTTILVEVPVGER